MKFIYIKKVVDIYGKKDDFRRYLFPLKFRVATLQNRYRSDIEIAQQPTLQPIVVADMGWGPRWALPENHLSEESKSGDLCLQLL